MSIHKRKSCIVLGIVEGSTLCLVPLRRKLQLLTDWSLSHKKNDEDYKGALLLDCSANCDVTSTSF